MGNTASSSSSSLPPLKKRPADIENLNDSVWQLYAPEGAPQVEVVFFHGLQLSNYEDAFWKTWVSRDGSVVWPKDWLSDSLRKAGIQPRILSISYDSCARGHDGEQDPYIITENLIQDLIDGAHVGQNCPMILVGHSLGGIIIKQLLLGCVKKRSLLSNRAASQPEMAPLDNFLGNCKGVFYYATPHAGSRLADYAARIPRMNNHFINLLTTLSKVTAKINSDFAISKGNVGNGQLMTGAIGENLETTYMFLTAKVVEEASARQDVDNFYIAPRADHFQVCKPTNKTTDAIYKNLLSLVTDVLEKSGALPDSG